MTNTNSDAEWAAFNAELFAAQPAVDAETAARCEAWAAKFVQHVRDAGIEFTA